MAEFQLKLVLRQNIMHELSIAMEILECVEREVSRYDVEKVSQLHLSVGKFSGVELRCLEFSLEAIKADTILSEAEIHYHTPDETLVCATCGEIPMSDSVEFICPHCGLPLNQQLASEILIKEIQFNVRDENGCSGKESPIEK